MSALGKQLFLWTKKTEEQQKQAAAGPYRPLFHLTPPVGWLNDPNGLCQYQGKYHLFFQYSPFEAEGGLKFWGHYSSDDLFHLDYLGAALAPDTPYDCHGVYSGSAIEHGGRLHLFYTGNVKLDGDYDYIHDGREAYTIKVTTEDGIHFSTKKVVLSPSDYPAECTAHVRDPKLYTDENGKFFMVLGARLKGDVHKGAILIYRSEDLEQFTFEELITTDDPFGFMWECPDIFTADGVKVLSLSPQGLPSLPHRFQNVYQSGYFTNPVYYEPITAEGAGTASHTEDSPAADSAQKESGSATGPEKKLMLSASSVEAFQEWDYGFDFYAPQSFQDDHGRQILIGWAGMPDADYSSLPAGSDWQHCFTVPREITIRDGLVYQQPVCELNALRSDCLSEQDVTSDDRISLDLDSQADILIKGTQTPLGDFQICFGEELSFSYRDHVLKLEFADGVQPLSENGRYSGAGLGRTIRTAKSLPVSDLRILFDASILEIYVNEGAYVFTTRVFQDGKLHLTAEGLNGHLEAYRLTL